MINEQPIPLATPLLKFENRTTEFDRRALRSVARLDSMLRWFRSCAVCHSPFPPIDLLCRKCWSRISAFQNHGANFRQTGYPFPVYSLFTWNQETEVYVRPLLHSFKGGRAFRAAQLFAETMTFELGDALRPARFVHPPSSSLSRYDHSWLLTNVLAGHWPGTETLSLKQKDGEWGSQKGKTAYERRLKRYEPIASCEKFSSQKTSWIFVDDVITSGSTAMAAYMALGDPDRFAALSLICRPKLAGKSTI